MSKDVSFEGGEFYFDEVIAKRCIKKYVIENNLPLTEARDLTNKILSSVKKIETHVTANKNGDNVSLGFSNPTKESDLEIKIFCNNG